MKEVIKERQGLYRQEFEHDNCGIGAVVNIKGKKSHDTVANALRIVENLDHRAGKDAEGKTGDGVGILLQISHKFFKKACKKEGIEIGQEREYGIGQFFFPQHEIKRAQAKKMFEIIVEKEGLEFLGWREVPVVPEVLGHKARECMPCIMQAFIKKPDDLEKGIAFDRKLYIARREFEQSNDNTYVCSMSSRTIVYKGMFLVGQLRTFFSDLQSPDYESAIALVHSRFSTNTNPSWERAHPNRLIVHNGEINTIRGNADKMLAREENMESINFLMIFDIVILGYGFLIVRGALQMHKTNVPASMLIPAEELTGCKDPVGFCEAMYQKTLVFGILCIVYGAVCTINEYGLGSIKLLNIIALTVFIIAVLWFCKEMRSAREKYLK